LRGGVRGPALPGHVADVHDGVRVGAPQRARHPQLPGRLQLHGALPALGVAGLLRGAAQQPGGGSPGHGSGWASHASLPATSVYITISQPSRHGSQWAHASLYTSSELKTWSAS